MKLNKAFKFRIYPNKFQQELIQKTFNCCRFIYNKMLEDRVAYYKTYKQKLNNTPAQYKNTFPWLREVDCQALCYESIYLQSAYNKFFKNLKYGFPKFKSKKFDKKSYTTNYIYVDKENNSLKLGKLGKIDCKFHRQIPIDYKVKSGTISQTTSGKYYIIILTEYNYEIPQPILDKNNSLGLDYSSHEFYVDSQGNRAEAPKFYNLYQNKIKQEQRKLSHMVYGSKNYEKQKIKLGKIYEKIINCRNDFLQKLSTQLASSYDYICLEGNDYKNMSQTLKLGKSTLDNSFGKFRTLLSQKMSLLGKKLVIISKQTPTTIVCSICGAYHKDIVTNLNIRKWICPDCGNELDRDINAAINIKNAGMQTLIN